MAESRVRTLLESAGVVPGDDGWLSLQDSRTITLHVAHSGVSLTVSRVRSVCFRESLLEALTAQGESYVVFVDDVFAVAVESAKDTGRKAGFV